jgi:hypothetical protein
MLLPEPLEPARRPLPPSCSHQPRSHNIRRAPPTILYPSRCYMGPGGREQPCLLMMIRRQPRTRKRGCSKGTATREAV